MAGVATLLVGVAARRTLRDEPAAHPGVNAAELAPIRGADAPARAAVDAAGPARIRPPSLAGLLGGRVGCATIDFGLLTWRPSCLVQATGTSEAVPAFFAGRAGLHLPGTLSIGVPGRATPAR